MANKLISEIPLPKSIANVFAARNIRTAKVFLLLLAFRLSAGPGLYFIDIRNVFSKKFEVFFFFFPHLIFKDALSLTEFELMELLDVGLVEVRSALSQISEDVAPPCHTVIENFTRVSFLFLFSN